MIYEQRATSSNNNEEEYKEKTINHSSINQIAQAEAINSATKQTGSRKIARTSSQSK
ncbi:hypothetical protein OA093_00815 [bacterium]|nr:hypothetical protein [bacterium]